MNKVFNLDIWVYLMALSVMAISPGPGIAALIATVFSRGAANALWFGFGLLLGDMVWLAFSMSGLAIIVQSFPWIFTVIKWAGVAYLLYLAYKAWFAPHSNFAPAEQQQAPSIASSILSGLSVTIGNPKPILFYVALLPTFVDMQNIDAASFITIMGSSFIVLVVVVTTYILIAHKAQKLFESKASYGTLNKAAAFAMLGAALWISTK